MSDEQYNEFKLGEWHVTPLRGTIHGPEGTRRVTPKAMDVLTCLAQHPGEVVDRETFQTAVWKGRAFSDDPLNKCIAELRRQLGDSSGARTYIETIPKRGYRLVADVQPVGNSLTAARPKGLARRFQPVALTALIGLAAFGVWRATQDLSGDAHTAIAVLPFASMGETGKQYFADGVHEELIGELSQGGVLAVRPRTSTLPYRDRRLPLQAIASELGVDVLVDGSVRQDGDTVRVTAQLIEAARDENLWAGSIEKSLSVASLFSIQNEIAQEIANALKVTLGGDESAVRDDLPTDDIDAYDAFMLGKFHYRRQLPGDIRESVQRFERAVSLDPQFVDAWDWLAYAYNHAATNVGYLTPNEAYPKARTAALRALELEPELATAMSILGYLRAVYDRDWVGALADLERSVELSPNDSGTVWSLAHVYAMLGRHDEAIALTAEFADRHADEGRNHLEVANRLTDSGRFDQALGRLDLAETHGAEPGMVAHARGVAFCALRDFEAARDALELAVTAKRRDATALGHLAYAYSQLGQRDASQALLEELEDRAQTERISRLVFATVHAGLANPEAAIDEIRAAIAIGDREAIGVRNDPFFIELHELPEFAALVEGLTMPRQSTSP